MDEPLSVVSADSSGTSDDFEILDGSSPSSPMTTHTEQTALLVQAGQDSGPGISQHNVRKVLEFSQMQDNARDNGAVKNASKILERSGCKEHNSNNGFGSQKSGSLCISSKNGDIQGISSTAGSGALDKNITKNFPCNVQVQPQFAIANNGSMADLQKQMSEVLQDVCDDVTKENDPAILKSLDASPESTVTLANKTQEACGAEETCSWKNSLKSSSDDAKHGITQCVSQLVEDPHPLSLPSSSVLEPASTAPKTDPSAPSAEKISCVGVNGTSSTVDKSGPHKPSSITPTSEKPSCDEYTIFNRVSYLGAAAISSACTHEEIVQKMSILNSEHQDQAIEVSLSVPSHSEGYVIIYDADNKQEITRYHISTIRKCVHGTIGTRESSCFNFTTIHGSSPATSIMQCHVFRCQIPEAVGKIVDCFGTAFRRVPKPMALGGAPENCSKMVASTTTQHIKHLFEISLEIREEDSKGNFYAVPKDKECFKLRCNLDKELHISVAPAPSDAHDSLDALVIERCFGLLVAPGHNVKHADMNLLEMVSCADMNLFEMVSCADMNLLEMVSCADMNLFEMVSCADMNLFEMVSCADMNLLEMVSCADMNLFEMVTTGDVGATSNGASNGSSNGVLPSLTAAQSKGYQVTGRWDPRDPVFASLNQETARDGRVLMSVAIDLVMKGIQEPVRFVLDIKVRVYPQNERFWYFTKRPLTHLFALKLKQVEITSSTSSLDELQFEVTEVENLGEVERLRSSLYLPLTLPSLAVSTFALAGGGRSPSISSVDTPAGEDDSDGDEPLLSGSGEVSKDCPQSELDMWKEVLPRWQAVPHQFPKGLAKLVRRGVPEALRGEVWQLLAGCANDVTMMENYRILLTKVRDVVHNCSKVRDVAHNCRKVRDVVHNCSKVRDVVHNCSKVRDVVHNCSKVRDVVHNCSMLLSKVRDVAHNCTMLLSKQGERSGAQLQHGERLVHNCTMLLSKFRDVVLYCKFLLTKECDSDQVIMRDIHRTFPAHEFFKESGGGGQDALYKISRAYAVFDEELAYCQGLSFLAAALLLHMPEEQAFCLLVKIMSDYGFRELFKDGFEVLHLRFYQLDRLMEEHVSDVYNHFRDLGVAVHMFASQWLLTLFTTKFPLLMVFRYLDLFLLVGFDSVFQVAIALLTMSRKELVALDFEGVLKFFRVSLPKKYRSEEAVHQLFKLANSIKVKKLEKYQREYVQIKERESGESVAERLGQENKRLLEEKLRLDAENDLLARRIDQLEEVCERNARDGLALRQTLAEADQEKTRLMLEATQVKELLKREVEHSDKEQQRSAAIVTEYKNICSQLTQRLDSERCQYLLTIENIKSRVSDCKASGCQCREALPGSSIIPPSSSSTCAHSDEDSSSTSSSTRSISRDQFNAISSQVRELELELAQTKLALVETQCKNQDVTHQLNSAIAELQGHRGTWFQKTLTSISGLKERTSRPLSPTQSAAPIPPPPPSQSAGFTSTDSNSQLSKKEAY
ncbi:PTB/PI domain [Trinorchestia longiramus]|nr:PTB/PI domain [Trinorchestia longiramus]